MVRGRCWTWRCLHLVSIEGRGLVPFGLRWCRSSRSLFKLDIQPRSCVPPAETLRVLRMVTLNIIIVMVISYYHVRFGVSMLYRIHVYPVYCSRRWWSCKLKMNNVIRYSCGGVASPLWPPRYWYCRASRLFPDERFDNNYNGDCFLRNCINMPGSICNKSGFVIKR